MTRQHLHIAYTSTVAPGLDADAVFESARTTARVRNAGLGIAGVLVFDGRRFVEWLHGPMEAVVQLVVSIAVDPRHSELAVRLEASLPAGSFDPTWCSGRVDEAAMDAFLAEDDERVEARIAGILRLAACGDLEPAQRVGQAIPGKLPDSSVEYG